MRCHEWPLGEPVVAVVVVGTRGQDHGSGSHRRPEEELHIAPPGGVEGDDNLDVLEIVDLGLTPGATGRLQGQKEGLVGGDLSGKLKNNKEDVKIISR